MPGKRYRWQHGPHRVRIQGRNAGHGEVVVVTDQGITYTAPMKELKPIAQKSTSPKKRRQPRRQKEARRARRRPEKSR